MEEQAFPMEVDQDQLMYIIEEDGTLTQVDPSLIELEDDVQMIEDNDDRTNNVEVIFEQMSQIEEASSSSSSSSSKLRNTDKHVCHICGKVSKRKRGLAQHVKIHAAYKEFKCYLENCGQELSISTNFKNHFDNIHKNPKHKKYVAGIEYSLQRARDAARMHYEQQQSSSNSTEGPPVRERNYPCRKGCNKMFYTANDRLAHEKIHSSFREFKCNFCNYSSVSSAAVKKHYINCHKSEKYDMNKCRQKKPQESQTIDSNRVELQCPKCPQVFKYQFRLDKHLPTHDPIICQICSKTFTTRSHLRDHKAAGHQNERNFKCDFVSKSGVKCTKSFRYNITLICHKKAAHQGMKPTCKICKKSFMWCSQLLYHVDKVHTGVTYTCAICKQNMSSKSYLDRHSKIHDKFPPVKCSCCDRTFYSSRAFDAHKRINKKKKPQGQFHCVGMSQLTDQQKERIKELKKKCQKIVRQKRQDRTEEQRTKKVRLLVWPCNHEEHVEELASECSSIEACKNKCTKLAFCWTRYEFEQMRLASLYEDMLRLRGCISINHHHLDDDHDMDVEAATFILECENETIVRAVKILFTEFIDKFHLTHVARSFPLFDFCPTALREASRLIKSFDLSDETEQEILDRITRHMDIRVPRHRRFCRDLPQIIFEAGLFCFRPQIPPPRFCTRRLLFNTISPFLMV